MCLILTKTEIAQHLLPKLPTIKFHEDLFSGSQAVICVEIEKWHNFNKPPAGMQTCIKVTAVKYCKYIFPSCKMKLLQVKWDHIFKFLPMTCWYKCFIIFTEYI
jgi:hypothetical protein